MVRCRENTVLTCHSYNELATIVTSFGRHKLRKRIATFQMNYLTIRLLRAIIGLVSLQARILIKTNALLYFHWQMIAWSKSPYYSCVYMGFPGGSWCRDTAVASRKRKRECKNHEARSLVSIIIKPFKFLPSLIVWALGDSMDCLQFELQAVYHFEIDYFLISLKTSPARWREPVTKT